MIREKRRVGIIGYGYVGRAMAAFFSKHYEILIHDMDAGLLKDVKLVSRDEINKCDLAVVCVPTGKLPDGSCDVSGVERVINWLSTPLILLKSTVAVGTTDQLKEKTGKAIVFSPEYCGESSYWTPYAFHMDIKETPFFIFGGDPRDTSKMVEYFLPVTGPVKQYRQTTTKAAEMAKYMENSFYATKITFCYEFATLCQRIGLDFNEVRELWLLDPRINPMHTAVFAQNSRPFSGKCLPKDISAIIKFAKDHGYQPSLLEEVARSNDRLNTVRAEMKIESEESVSNSMTGRKRR